MSQLVLKNSLIPYFNGCHSVLDVSFNVVFLKVILFSSSYYFIIYISCMSYYFNDSSVLLTSTISYCISYCQYILTIWRNEWHTKLSINLIFIKFSNFLVWRMLPKIFYEVILPELYPSLICTFACISSEYKSSTWP